jgi:hypothetical protein
MLAPPPEGTFDIDKERLPLKSSEKVDSSPEQAPLLAREEGEQEEEEENNLVGSSASGKSKVRWNLNAGVIFFYFFT